MLETVGSVDWPGLPQPHWNSSHEVPLALLTLIHVQSEKDKREAYNHVLFALGNNHAGTYYPVVLSAIPFLGEMLGHNKPLVREAALDTLLDLVASFGPEPCFETIQQTPGIHVPLKAALREAVASLLPQIGACISAAPMNSRERGLIAELMQELE